MLTIVLEKALDGSDPRSSAEIYFGLLLERTQLQLEEARLTALRRSGARGWDARAEEVEAEKRVSGVDEQYVLGLVPRPRHMVELRPDSQLHERGSLPIRGLLMPLRCSRRWISTSMWCVGDGPDSWP